MDINSFAGELGIDFELNDPASNDIGVRGLATVFPEICIPGTDIVRTSVILTWADILTGTVAGHAILPRVPITQDLEVQIERPARLGHTLRMEASPLRIGGSVVVCEARMWDADTGDLVAMSIGSFVRSPDPAHVFTGGFPMPTMSRCLDRPLAERVDCRVTAPGTAEVPHQPGNLNPGGALQGGLYALVAEEAAASLHDEPVMLESINVRYLSGIRTGSARAEHRHGRGDSVIYITDSSRGTLAAVVTGHAHPCPPPETLPTGT